MNNKENNELYKAQLVLPVIQATNKKVGDGKCYGFNMEWALWKLNPNTKTVFKIREQLPLMPIKKINEYNESINTFIPMSERINTFMSSQFLNHIRDPIEVFQQSSFKLFDSGLVSIIRMMDNAFTEDLHQVCCLQLYQAVGAHVVSFKKSASGEIHFFDSNCGEFKIQDMEKFIAWLPNYLTINYGNVFYSYSYQTVKLPQEHNLFARLYRSANDIFNQCAVLAQYLCATPLGLIYSFPSLVEQTLSDWFVKDKPFHFKLTNKTECYDDNLLYAKNIQSDLNLKSKNGCQSLNHFELNNRLLQSNQETRKAQDDMSLEPFWKNKLTKINHFKPTNLNKITLSSMGFYKKRHVTENNTQHLVSTEATSQKRF